MWGCGAKMMSTADLAAPTVRCMFLLGVNIRRIKVVGQHRGSNIIVHALIDFVFNIEVKNGDSLEIVLFIKGGCSQKNTIVSSWFFNLMYIDSSYVKRAMYFEN